MTFNCNQFKKIFTLVTLGMVVTGSAMASGMKDIASHAVINDTGVAVGSITSPNAMGSNVPFIFLAGTYVNHWRDTSKKDGLMSLGASFGDPYKHVGVLVTSTFDSLGTDGGSFGADGGVGIRFNHYFAPNTSLAAGMGNMKGWGSKNRRSNNFYMALTQTATLCVPVTFNVGIGTGALNDFGDMTAKTDKNVGAFGGLGISPLKNLSLMVDWTVDELSAGGVYGLSVIPKLPIFVGLYGINLNKANGTRSYFKMMAGMAYTFQ